jgi:hypothetical protein
MVEIIASQEIWMYIYKPRPPIVVGALAALLAPKNARPAILRRKMESITKIKQKQRGCSTTTTTSLHTYVILSDTGSGEDDDDDTNSPLKSDCDEDMDSDDLDSDAEDNIWSLTTNKKEKMNKTPSSSFFWVMTKTMTTMPIFCSL